VVAISNDETGISMDPDVRFAVAKKMFSNAPWISAFKPADIRRSDRWVMPIRRPGDARPSGLRTAFNRLRHELKVNTTCGLSNVFIRCYRHRHGINAGFTRLRHWRRHDLRRII